MAREIRPANLDPLFVLASSKRHYLRLGRLLLDVCMGAPDLNAVPKYNNLLIAG